MVLEYHKEGLPMMALNPFDDAWWERLAWISEICKKKSMTYLIQDAAPFPTGAANGWLEKEEYKHLNKLYITERHMDIKGPYPEGKFLVGDKVASPNGDYQINTGNPADCRLLSVCALKRENDDSSNFEDICIALDDHVQDGVLYWNVPVGSYRIFVIYETYEEGGRKGYMNLLDPESVQLQIKAVHQPHYEHLKDELGQTWLGFFYDETEIGNVTNLHGYIFDMLPGRHPLGNNVSIALPWSRYMPELCRDCLGDDYAAMLPMLWYDGQKRHAQVRFHYMDIVSKQIAKNYNTQVYAWCHERNILYIGHNLEDENSHAHLGCGPVHYFRMQEGQDMAGIDLIGGQNLPGMDSAFSWFGAHDSDGEFYHYGLAKLASSAGHIDPKKKNRSFCELLAVYGKVAGPKLRKYVVDHLLVNGINNMIFAEALSQRHAMKYNRLLDDYTNRMCHLFNDIHVTSEVALLYHAESEWTDDAQYFQRVGHALAAHQISYDVVPQDIFIKTDFYKTDTKHGLTVNGIVYKTLVIPGCKQIPEAVLTFASKAKQQGFPVIVTDNYPESVCENGASVPEDMMAVVATNNLAEHLKTLFDMDFDTDHEEPYLRYHHFMRSEGNYYFLHNENALADIDCTVYMQMTAPVYKLDMMNMTVSPVKATDTKDGAKIKVHLGKYEAALYFSGELPEEIEITDTAQNVCWQILDDQKWHITLVRTDGKTEKIYENTQLFNINGKDGAPFFFGNIVYETKLEGNFAHVKVLSLGQVEEACTLWVNGQLAGVKIAEPYMFDVSGMLKDGYNSIKIIVQNSPAHEKQKLDMQALFEAGSGTGYTSLPQGGLLGPMMLG